MTVVRNSAGTFDVVDIHLKIETDFPTMASAWRWIHGYDGEPISHPGKRRDWIVSQILGGSL